MKLLLRTISGSRLYGLSHAGSDEDWIEVYGWDKGRGVQKIKDGQDVTRASFDSFMRYCDKGVPQYLEAMFSPVAEVDEISAFRQSYTPNMTNVRDTYMRTIKSFWMHGIENDDFKRRRHAARLILNLRSMEESGRFTPALTPVEIDVRR